MKWQVFTGNNAQELLTNIDLFPCDCYTVVNNIGLEVQLNDAPYL